MKKTAKTSPTSLRYVGIGLGLLAILLIAFFSFPKTSPVSHEEDTQVAVKPEDCRYDTCAGRTGLTGDQIIFGLPLQSVSGTYTPPAITNGQTRGAGWVHYTDSEHTFKISHYSTGFDSSYFIHFYPSGSKKIDEAGCLTTGKDGLENPEQLIGDDRIYRDETSSPRSYAVQGISWCQITLRSVAWHKTDGDFFEAFSTPVKNGTLVVYAMLPSSRWLKCEDTDFNPAVYNNIQTKEACEIFNANAMAKVQEAHLHPERITSGGMTDAGWVSGGTLKELLETFTRISGNQ